MNFLHYPVMNKEIVNILAGSFKDLFIDCTIGMGGHSYYILKDIKNSKVIAIDVDDESIKQAKINLKEFSNRVTYFRFNYVDLFQKIDLFNKKVSGILIDPGISMFQLRSEKRGFSHNIDSYLDMRKDKTQRLTAYDVINSFKEDQLIKIFESYGEVKKARELSKAIIEKRLFGCIKTTFDLKKIIERIYGNRLKKGKVHPAAKVFQALRIFVNREFKGVENFLKEIPNYLNSGAKIFFLTYHSIEDRLVKKKFNFLEEEMKIRILKPFPMFPSEAEIIKNPTSKSAKLRVAEVI